MFGRTEKKKLAAVMTLATTRGATGGLVKRIDENRELLEHLMQEVPELLESHWWIASWIESNDSFFTQLDEILGGAEQRHWIKNYPRPFPISSSLLPDIRAAIQRDQEKNGSHNNRFYHPSFYYPRQGGTTPENPGSNANHMEPAA